MTHSPAPLCARESRDAGLCWIHEAGSTTTRRDNSCQAQISVDPAASLAQPCQTTLGTDDVFCAGNNSLAFWNLFRCPQSTLFSQPPHHSSHAPFQNSSCRCKQLQDSSDSMAISVTVCIYVQINQGYYCPDTSIKLCGLQRVNMQLWGWVYRAVVFLFCLMQNLF